MANNSNENQNIDSKDFLIGSLVGGIIGASVALLCAPRSGKELRSNLNGRASYVRDRASEWKDVAYEKGTEWKDIATEKSQGLSGRMPFKTRDASAEEEAERAAEEVAQAIEEAAEELEREEGTRTTGV